MKQNKPASCTAPARRLRRFFVETDLMLRKLTPERCSKLYEQACAHSLRGFSATLGLLSGILLAQVAAQLGHESSTTTLQSYAAPGTVETFAMQQVIALLDQCRPGTRLHDPNRCSIVVQARFRA